MQRYGKKLERLQRMLVIVNKLKTEVGYEFGESLKKEINTKIECPYPTK